MSQWGRLGILMCLLFTTQVWASIGKVSLLKGEASASRNNQAVALSNGVALEEHDIITTHANSQIQLTFEDKTVITLGSESILDIKEYLNDAQEPKAKFKFSQGTFKSITGQMGKKAPENFNLETRTATIGIRGTTVVGEVGQGESPDTIGCSSGRIVVSNTSGSVTLNAGFQTTVSKTQSPTPPAALSPTLIISSKPTTPSTRTTTPSSSSQQSDTKHTFQASQQTAQADVAGQLDNFSTEQATQTNRQAHTATSLNTLVSHNTDTEDTIDIIASNSSNSFSYPTFTPKLQAASTRIGTISLNGFATSSYIQDGTTLTSTSDTMAFNLDTSNNRITNSEAITSAITLDRIDPYQISLAKASDALTMTYKNLNKFAIKDFNNQAGWMQTKSTYTNDYVSWGYWAMNVNDDSILLPTTNYWVAGKNIAAANTHIETLMAGNGGASYTYNGHVIGSVSNGVNSYSIDPTTNNAVKLNFNFGGGLGSLLNTSYIQFQTIQATPQVWQITPNEHFGSGSFTINTPNSVTINGIKDSTSTSTVVGQFYGSAAQAVGGTFKAISGSNTAMGVFKAVR